MEKLITYVGDGIGWQSLAVIICLLVTGLPSFIKGFDYLVDRFGIETKGMRKRKENNNRINNLEQKLAAMDTENHNHWDVSKCYQQSYADTQKEIIDKLSSLTDKITEMQATTDARFAASEEKDNKRARAELKDKIGERYRRFHEKGEINDIEMEALEDLIEEYEAAGGENSFVHTLVQKEMYTWTRVEKE